MQPQSLALLYLPLMGQDAFLLYEVLNALSGALDKQQLLDMTGFSQSRFDKARESLEMFGLLDTWLNPVDESQVLELHPPKSPKLFFQHGIYSRMLLQKLGSKRFDQLAAILAGRPDRTGMQKMSRQLDADSLELGWSESKEKAWQESKPTVQTGSFDWDKFYTGHDTDLPLNMRTPANEEIIASLANLYGLTEEQMRIHVVRACPRPLRNLNIDTLKDNVRKARPNAKAEKSYDMSPVRFLQTLQNGIPVSNPDKKIIEKLVNTYRFSNETANSLIDYILRTNNKKFFANYVYKIAAEWVRLGIDSRQQALDWEAGQGKTKARQAVTDKPDWYDAAGTYEADPELDARLDRLLHELED
jgi:replication initiation and membrane attachment protein